jgi:hypothetical protein
VTVNQPALPEVPTPTPLPPPQPPPPEPPPTPTPPPPPCTQTLEPAAQTIAAGGGSGTIAVTSGAGCAWTATTTASWITITGGTPGQGTGTVSFTAAPNAGASRSATIQIGTGTATITQPAPACTYTISPSSQAFPAAGDNGSVAVTAGAGCSWTATEVVPWISITSGATGSGNGTVNFSVDANTGAARSATLTIAGRAFTVTQAAAACSYSIAPTGQSVAAAGGTGTIAVTSASGCTWNAINNANWLTITSAASGSGNGSVTFSAAANTGPARTGTLTIAGQTFTVTQEGCNFVVAPSTQNVPATAGTASVSVTTAGSCTWNATSNAAWIAVTSGAPGTGNGQVTLTVTPNSGAARSGTVTVAGQMVTLNQAAGVPCTFSISPTSQNQPVLGSSGTVAVTAGNGCSWSATSNNVWLVITAGSTGSGNGTVTYRALPNTNSDPRTGTLTIAGQTFTVTQSGFD